MLGNQVDAGVIHAPVLLPEIKSGLIRVLATGRSLTRIEYPPVRDTKTLRQLNIPVSFGIVRVLMAPKGTPKAVVAKLASLAKKAVATSSYHAFGRKFGVASSWVSGAQETKDIHEQLKTFKTIKAKYIK